MADSRRPSAARFALVALACAFAAFAFALAGCSSDSSAPESSTGSASTASPPSPAKLAAYAKLLTIEDVKRISKVSDVTTMPPGSRQGDSPYYVLYTSPSKPQFLAFRVGKPEAFEEQRTLLVDRETTLTVSGREAISWSSSEFDNGIAVRMPDSTYMFSSRWVFTSPEGTPQLTMDQVKEFAELVVERSK